MPPISRVQPELEDRLIQGLAQISLALTTEQRARCLDFLEHLYRWNRVHSLTAVPSLDMAVDRHLLDALQVAPGLAGALAGQEGQPLVLDVGAGTGVPGIPLAIALPQTRWTLVERVARKAAFLRQAISRLGLAGRVSVAQADVRDLQMDSGCEIILSRAFAALPRFVDWTFHLSNSSTQWVYLAGRMERVEGLDAMGRVDLEQESEVSLLPNRPRLSVRVEVLGQAVVERHVVWIRQKA